MDCNGVIYVSPLGVFNGSHALYNVTKVRVGLVFALFGQPRGYLPQELKCYSWSNIVSSF